METSASIHIPLVLTSVSTDTAPVPFSISDPSGLPGSIKVVEETKKLSVMVPKSLHKELRLHSASSDSTITDVVILALQSFLYSN